MGFLSNLIFIGFACACYQNKPDIDSLKTFLKNYVEKEVPSTPLDVYTKIIGKSLFTSPEFHLQDYMLFKMGYTKIGGTLSQSRFVVTIGALKNWLVLYDDAIHKSDV
jgi:hypothetical protein